VTEEDCGFHWFIDEALERLYAVSKYYTLQNSRSNLMTSHVLQLKRDREYAVPIAQALALIATNSYKDLLDVDLVVPVPLHSTKRTERGFDQAEEIGRALSLLLNRPIGCHLVKTRNVSIHSIPRLMDKINEVEGLYSCSEDLGEKSVLLVDDVATSGLDLGECARVLRLSGASRVRALVGGRTVFRT
jgi:predicted amidophosphoribosyltransferase